MLAEALVSPIVRAPVRCLPSFAICACLLLLLNSCASGKLQPVMAAPPPVTTGTFAAAMADVAKSTWTEGNEVRSLVNGKRFFPAMLDAIRGAKHNVTFETYVCVDSPQVEEFTQAFIDRAQAGVKVHLILDAYGCNTYGRKHITQMREAGVEVRFYSTLDLLRPLRYNHRTHRRVLVADGRVGFVGGAGIAYAWDSDADSVLRWRDTMYQVRGPVVAQLQEAFNDNWEELTEARLTGADYFPELRRVGSMKALSLLGSPEKCDETIGSSYLLALRSARSSIRIAHAYLIPRPEITEALVEALQRGVRVDILMPGKHTDMPICLPVALPSLRRMLAAGAHLHVYEPCMMHGKLLLIDDYLTIVGSGNLDSRSFFINDENNLLVLSSAFAKEQLAMFERDKSKCRRITSHDLRSSLGRSFYGFLGRLVEYQL